METRSPTFVLDIETSPFSAEDYVQMACQLRRSAEIQIRYPDGKSGGIVVNKGELWHAWDSLGGGDEAFLRMVGYARATSIRALAASDTTTRSITESCQKLLLQALIERDASNVTASHISRIAPHVSRNVQSDPDSELTRPDWPALRNATAPASEPETEAVTARSYTERPVEVDARPAVKLRSITTFLRRPSVLQRGTAALFGAILLVSVGQILASPAGGNREAVASPRNTHAMNLDGEQTRSASASTRALTKPHDKTETVGAAVAGVTAPVPATVRPSEVVLQVSSLETVGWIPTTPVFTRVHDVSATGAHDVNTVARQVMSATPQFAACYDWAVVRSSAQSGMGSIGVVIHFDAQGQVLSASSRGGKLRGLNTCVAELAERLGMHLKVKNGPSRVGFTVTYQQPNESGLAEANSEIH